jgi:hypothetical protein
MVTRRTLTLLGIGTVFGGHAIPGLAGSPKILSVGGQIAMGNAEFSIEDLVRIGLARIETTTPWHQGKVLFEGVRLDQLMKWVGATGTKVRAVALNDYVAEVPIADFEAHGPILAHSANGKAMSVREKGPTMIVYPYDTNPALRGEVYLSRSVWQVKSLIVAG